MSPFHAAPNATELLVETDRSTLISAHCEESVCSVSIRCSGLSRYSNSCAYSPSSTMVGMSHMLINEANAMPR